MAAIAQTTLPAPATRKPRRRAAAKPATVKLKKVAANLDAGGIKITYHRTAGVDDFVRRISAATPMQLVEVERQGVGGVLIKDLSRHMEIPASRLFAILGLPKATAESKASSGAVVRGNGGRAALGVVRLLGIAQTIVANSTAPEAKNFDSAKWLGQWLERPQPALGGRKPADLIDTPTGLNVVARLLGSIESGAYQ